MSKIIRTLSLEGYVSRESRDGYATALLAKDDTSDGRGDVIQHFVDSSFFPEDTRVNVDSGVITAPASLKGCGLLRHSGTLRDMPDQYRIRSKDGFNTFLQSLKS
jgi:hypothetical protein